MSSLYRYTSPQYVDDFVRKGLVRFRALSYYRDYEDAQVRGDEFEGTRLHRPLKGLEITLCETQEKLVLPHTFESTANEDDIFVFCLSTILSSEIAQQFKSSVCVEICKAGNFIAAIRNSLLIRPSIKDKMLVHGPINYYLPEQPPIIDWALPNKIAMSKLNCYEPQQEYRLSFAVNDAFLVENTHVRLVAPDEQRVGLPHIQNVS